MKIFNEKSDCCGCTACMNICPKNAIKMQDDEEGFKYPKIDTELCIECGLCKKVCSFNESYKKDTLLNVPLVYAARNKNEKERLTSRSGGAFVAFAQWIIENGGIVYGVGYDENFNVCHKRIMKKEEINEIKGSKYVQSDLKNIFKEVKKDLEDNRYVLFSGTSCQISGLRSFLKNLDNNEKFFTCDIVCHGVPSPLIWNEYLNFIKKNYGANIKKVDFRDKTFGWNTHFESFCISDSKNEKKVTTNFYKDLFYRSLIIRQSCFKCYYSNTKRPSDITLGDFWGVEKVMPDMFDNKGVSLLLINTRKGKRLFEESLERLIVKESNIEECMQHNLKAPTKYNPKRKAFWDSYKKRGFKYVLKKYTEYGLKRRVEKKVIYFINNIKKLIRKR